MQTLLSLTFPSTLRLRSGQALLRAGFFLFCCGVGACTSSPKVLIHTAAGKEVSVTVELADTPEKRRLGLMYRQDLKDGEGMFFLFPKEEPLTFWMKNTPLSLDIIFINRARQIVGIAKETTPYSEKPLPSGKPAQFVLEVLAGFCQRRGVEVGDRVEFQFPYDRVDLSLDLHRRAAWLGPFLYFSHPHTKRTGD